LSKPDPTKKSFIWFTVGALFLFSGATVIFYGKNLVLGLPFWVLTLLAFFLCWKTAVIFRRDRFLIVSGITVIFLSPVLSKPIYLLFTNLFIHLYDASCGSGENCKDLSHIATLADLLKVKETTSVDYFCATVGILLIVLGVKAGNEPVAQSGPIVTEDFRDRVKPVEDSKNREGSR